MAQEVDIHSYCWYGTYAYGGSVYNVFELKKKKEAVFEVL